MIKAKVTVIDTQVKMKAAEFTEKAAEVAVMMAEVTVSWTVPLADDTTTTYPVGLGSARLAGRPHSWSHSTSQPTSRSSRPVTGPGGGR